MIEGIKLSRTDRVNSSSLNIPTPPGVTIFVGPNNSGKSALLEGIYNLIRHDDRGSDSALENITILPFDDELLKIHRNFVGKADDEIVDIASHGAMHKTDAVELIKAQWDGRPGKEFRSGLSIWMNGAKRLSLLPPERDINLYAPTEPLGLLFMDDGRRLEYQEAVYAGIKYYPIIDSMSRYGKLSLSFSKDKPNPKIEKELSDSFKNYLSNSLPSSNASDGFNAYAGMLGALYATEYRCILIDEPEAFLHPALARLLGRQLATRAAGTDRMRVFVATHSADFIMGAIESGVSVNIVRLQFQSGVSEVRLLANETLRQFMNDPILRSANVMSGLFSKSVVVSESDTDRAFYQEVNTRLAMSEDARAIEDPLFLNAQNKQTVPRIIRLLRSMGVPAAGIVDLDVISEGGVNWSNQIEAIGMPAIRRNSIGLERRDLYAKLKDRSSDDAKKEFKKKGINVLEEKDREAAVSFLNNIAEYGLFIIYVGEVEAWLSDLTVSRSKDSWLHKIFKVMGSDARSSAYVRPSTGDVWDFVGTCNKWLSNPNRFGMTPEETEVSIT